MDIKSWESVAAKEVLFAKWTSEHKRKSYSESTSGSKPQSGVSPENRETHAFFFIYLERDCGKKYSELQFLVKIVCVVILS